MTETIYEGVHYMIPHVEMKSWLRYMKDLSISEKDSGNLQIAFSDKFRQYIKEELIDNPISDWIVWQDNLHVDCLHRFEKPGTVSHLSCPCPRCIPSY